MIVYEGKTFKNITSREARDGEFENCSFVNCDFSNGSFASGKLTVHPDQYNENRAQSY
jgi:hypothetical protein